MLVQNNNPVNPLTRPADLSTVLPVADQKTQQVSKGFFASLGQFAVKLLKTVVILATFPVSLPLMYLVSKIKNASTKASSIDAELTAKPKQNEPSAVASPTQQALKEEEEEEPLIPQGFFDEQPPHTTNQQPVQGTNDQSRSFFNQTLTQAASGVQGAALTLAGTAVAGAAYLYGSASSINAPLSNLTQTLANATSNLANSTQL